MQVPAFSHARQPCARSGRSLSLRSADHAGHLRRPRLRSPGDDPGLSRHRQVDPHRAGGRAPQLADDPRQSRQPCQPHRPGGQGRHRPEGRQADHRIPRRHAALVPAASDGPGVRRIRRRPPGRDVRHPAGAGSSGQAHPARPEPGDPAQPLFPPVLHHQHHRPRRHHRPLSRHPADQSGPDGPLVDRHHAELSGPRRGGRDRPGQVADLRQDRRRAGARSPPWSGSPT